MSSGFAVSEKKVLKDSAGCLPEFQVYVSLSQLAFTSFGDMGSQRYQVLPAWQFHGYVMALATQRNF
jgi:hypothetical protein